MAEARLGPKPSQMSLVDKLGRISWGLIFLTSVIACIGFGMLYSAADGNMNPWASRQILRFAAGLIVVLVIAVIDIRIWMRWAYVIYVATLATLFAVEFFGLIGMGAQRWLYFGWFQLQPSELMKIALVLALARYFHRMTLDDARRPALLVTPILMLLAPMVLVLRQPDLGTAAMLVVGAGAIFFVSGVALRYFAIGGAIAAAGVPIAWQFLREYQRERILTFLNPEADPLGAGYHILQSKIALGSGGLFGRGFMHGTQSHLSFLPEHQTDFIFTMLAEELGLVGAATLIGLYVLLFAYGFAIALRARNHFGRLLGIGLTTTLFLYVFINIAMVVGLIPVVGVPLPLISYGGTAMITVLFSLGLLMCVFVHRDEQINRLTS
ncbi:MAG: Rod shape-determining protein RodA [Alphaproteobacteria bacterium MarineAlpha9_Bin6]|nr:MAG: Rod shape-determining protein RodA [Alphaproteobacteria bacterium MarineAlpha9_Bin6]HIB55819.1 rod shape-determining protein RodA [Alphaproteobacteria bacterium]